MRKLSHCSAQKRPSRKASASLSNVFHNWRILVKVCSSGGSLEISVKRHRHVANEDAAKGPHLRFDYLSKARWFSAWLLLHSESLARYQNSSYASEVAVVD